MTAMFLKAARIDLIISTCFVIHLISFLLFSSAGSKFKIKPEEFLVYSARKLWQEKTFFYRDIVKVVFTQGEYSYFLKIYTSDKSLS